jgi:hypothetical protein
VHGVAECSRRDCSELAAREVRWEQPWPPPNGPVQLIGVDLCEQHASGIEAKLCERDGCTRFAELVIAIDGHSIETGEPRTRELRVCEPCWEAMQAAPSVTLNGVRMVHDGSGRMKALPSNIGRG